MSAFRLFVSLLTIWLLPLSGFSQPVPPSPIGHQDRSGSPVVRDGWHMRPYALELLRTGTSPRPIARVGAEAFSIRGASQDMQLLWANYFASQEAAGAEEAYASAVDVSGNVYVTGSSTRLPFGSDYLTVKLGPGGNQLWAVRYGGHTEGENIAWAVTVDGLGNVYVTGESPDLYYTDIATIKYNALGVEQWVARWAGEAGLHDAGAAIVVDDAGNVYVAGRTMKEDRCDDAVLLSYSPLGEERWSRRYQGPPAQSTWNEAVPGLALLPSGSVCAAMTTTGSDSSEDLLVVCLDGDGGELWSDLFTGPMGSDNTFESMAVQYSGALIVGATSDGWGTGQDYLILRYGSGGYREWDVHFDGPGSQWGDLLVDVAVDDSGNVYACGSVDDYAFASALLALDRYGNQRWVEYRSATADFDIVESVLFVAPDAVRLVGETMPNAPFGANEVFVIEFDTSGTLRWDARTTPSGCSAVMVNGAASEPTGATYVTTFLQTLEERENYGVVKVGAGGGIIFETQYDGPGTSYDQVLAGWVHPSGALSMGGWTMTGSGRIRARTVRFAPDGAVQWVQQYYSPTDSSAAIRAVTGDKEGNTYATGFTYEAASDLDIVTIKYTPDGMEQWKDRYIVPGADLPEGIVVDDSGNVYVVGTLNAYTGSSAFLVLKYGPDGSRLWENAMNVPDSASNMVQAVAGIPGGGVCFAGSSWGTGQQRGMAVVILKPSGDHKSAVYTSTSGYAATAYDVAVSQGGEVVVAGSEPDAASRNCPFVVRYSPEAFEDWHLTLPPVGTWEAFDRVMVLPWGDVQLLGHTAPDQYQSDLLVMCLRPDGQERWRAEYASEFGGDDYPASLCCDSTGDVYVIASCQMPQTMSEDCIVLRYDGQGTLKQMAWFPGPGTSAESPLVSGIDQEGDLVVGGTERGSRSNWSVMRAMKFSSSLTSVDLGVQMVPYRAELAQNYPNPFNAATVITYALPTRSHVALTVFNMLGQQVSTLVRGEEEAGFHEVKFDATSLASGVYLYRLHVRGSDSASGRDSRGGVGDFVQTKKLILIR